MCHQHQSRWQQISRWHGMQGRARREGAGERCSAGQTGERESGPERQIKRGWQCRTGRGWGVASERVGEQGASACLGGARSAVRRGGDACRAHRKRVLGPVFAPHMGNEERTGTEHWVARASGALRLAARAMGVDTVREVRRGGCGGQLGGQQRRERENREGERARRLSRGGQWACRARIGCARDALQGGASRTGMRAQGIARGGSARRGHRGEGRPTILLPRCGITGPAP